MTAVESELTKAVPAKPKRTHAPSRWLLPGLLAIGVICCIVQYVARISFWHDEAYQVLNVMEQSASELISTLGRNQTAPPLFMVALKTLGNTLGYSEYSLRLMPMLAGVLAILLYPLLTRRVLAPSGALVAAGLLALSPKLIEHASEVKQYSGDVLCTILLLLAACRLFDWRLSGDRPSGRDAAPSRPLLLLSLFAAALFWYSEVQVFIYAGIGLALLPRFLTAGRRKGLSCWLLCLTPALLSFAAIYFVSMRWQRSGSLVTYWVDRGGLPDYAHPATVLLWLPNAIRQLFNYACNPIGPATLALAIIGGTLLWRLRQRELLLALILPIALTLLAAFGHAYPFGGSRATMFLVPIAFLLAGCGVTAMLQWSIPWRKVGVALAAVMLLSGTVQAAYNLAVPGVVAHIRPAVTYVRAHRSPDQAIWIAHPNSWVEFLCYWPNPDPLVWGPKQPPLPEVAREFWLVVSFNPDQGIAKRQPQLDAAAKIADPVERHITSGGAAILFRVRDNALARAAANPPRDR